MNRKISVKLMFLLLLSSTSRGILLQLLIFLTEHSLIMQGRKLLTLVIYDIQLQAETLVLRHVLCYKCVFLELAASEVCLCNSFMGEQRR